MVDILSYLKGVLVGVVPDGITVYLGYIQDGEECIVISEVTTSLEDKYISDIDDDVISDIQFYCCIKSYKGVYQEWKTRLSNLALKLNSLVNSKDGVLSGVYDVGITPIGRDEDGNFLFSLNCRLEYKRFI